MSNFPDTNLAVCVLAAGKGTRMRSELPKVMHRLAGVPLLAHVLETAETLEPARIVVVVGPGMLTVEAQAYPHAVARQERQLGTGDAVRAALPALSDLGSGILLVLYGDTPLVTPETLRRLLSCVQEGAAAAVLGMRVAPPNPYGRLVTDAGGGLLEIVEASEADETTAAITLCNSGVMALDSERAQVLLPRLQPANSKGEYYLTDIVRLARAEGGRVSVVEAPAEELAGINNRVELAAAESVLQRRLRERAMIAGVTLSDPQTVHLAADTKLGRDVVIGQHVVFGPGVTVEDGVEIKPFSHIEGGRLRRNAIVGPFARIRPGSDVGEAAHVGNFVELKNTSLAAGAKANHLTYLGDAAVGARTNVGAGTITCNYDGFAKHRTTIGADVFIGSDTALVAPVTIGDGAMIAAGSTITEDVSADATAIARGRQIEKPGHAAAFRAARQKQRG